MKGLADSLEPLVEQSGKLIAAQTQLGEYIDLLSQRRAVVEQGLGEFLQFVEEREVLATDYANSFDQWVVTKRALALRSGIPALRDASGLRLEAVRAEFNDRDRSKLAADRNQVRSRLMKRVPPAGVQSGPKKKWTEMGLLRNEFGKERKFVPVRDLLRRAPGAVQAMKPCFMMSPLSLAKFAQAGALKFDVLVIDEASQMRPEDAMGGLLRTSQIVVVGDPKQLPPTDFFARTSGEDAEVPDDEDENVGESILELCQKTFRKTRMLRWHYRSKCESLIAFSNKNFYRNELITFPSPRPNAFSIDHQFVGGIYSTGRNPTEATKAVEEAVRAIRESGSIGAMPSIGIVAVNSEQRELIKTEWDRLTARDPVIEQFREATKARGEEFFIKNLENVQGDERDIIVISMTYGPAPGQTKPHQRFGPIAGKNGHRRLNVLFSRARDRIVLITSLRSTDVVAKTEAPGSSGSRVLHDYLRYAEAGGQEVPDHVGGEPDSDFEVAVRDRLTSQGFTVHTQVGVSGYKIDLGIINPDRPSEYLAGVECDGATYHSSKSARDRDRLRQDCLQEKGWTLIRIWSTDWFENADAQTARVVAELQELRLSAKKKAEAQIALRSEAKSGSQLTTASSNVVPLRDSGRWQEPAQASTMLLPQRGDAYANDPATRSAHVTPEKAVPDFEADALYDRAEREVAATVPSLDPKGAGSPDYVTADLRLAAQPPDPDRFYEPSYFGAIRSMVDIIIAAEGPVFRDIIVKRIARHHRFARTGSQIVERVERAIDKKYRQTEEGERAVVWPINMSPELPIPYRGGVPDQREVSDVPIVELASVASSYLSQGLSEEDALQAMRSQFGLGRLREANRGRFEAALRMVSNAG